MVMIYRTLTSSRHVEDKRPLCQLSSKRLEDNWHSGLLSSTQHRLSGKRSPDCRRVNHLRPTGSRTPDSRSLFCNISTPFSSAIPLALTPEKQEIAEATEEKIDEARAGEAYQQTPLLRAVATRGHRSG